MLSTIKAEKKFLILQAALIMIIIMGLFAANSYSSVEGECDNCHTMYNSQNGHSVDGDEKNKMLLISDCVGCHSSDDPAVWKNDVGAPIVFSRSAPRFGFNDGAHQHGLAGGNFFWVTLDDSRGHNVSGIAAADPNYSKTPGSSMSFSCGEADCHNAGTPLLCTSCHSPKHHANDSNQPVDYEGGFYRFIGHLSETWPEDISDHVTAGVIGVEDPDWEQNPSSTVHNEYCGSASSNNNWPFNTIGSAQSISGFCAGCHNDFHRSGNTEGVGTASPWLRHPVGVALSDNINKEYKDYKTYNPQAPIARPAINGYSQPSGAVNPGIDQVQCLSCHRAHGSPYPDMLRWDYYGMQAGAGENATGCFICHTTKDTGGRK